jgi:hypothetical protein
MFVVDLVEQRFEKWRFVSATKATASACGVAAG